MKRSILYPAIFAGMIAGSFAAEKASEAPAAEAPKESASGVQDIKIKMVTNKGTIEATLYASKAPMTVANFLNLAKRGYYDGIAFHRVIPNFMVQGGDPTETGRGGPGYRFGDEIVAELKHDKPGMFSMANAGPGTNGSQFFITHVPTPWLDGKHTVFGTVTKGQDVVNKIVGKLQQPGWKGDGTGDKIQQIEILDSADALFKAQAAKIKEWNEILDKAKKE
ncbi:MAG: peptidylprolyl isomerase [Akkermansiaceae bacterium]|nr:peptidylprolyl isomerase [Akkermansiaceae bacterium]NNM27991.1 peptidylprolyl isomerase [Akkermansiaceae bacterium]